MSFFVWKWVLQSSKQKATVKMVVIDWWWVGGKEINSLSQMEDAQQKGLQQTEVKSKILSRTNWLLKTSNLQLTCIPIMINSGIAHKFPEKSLPCVCEGNNFWPIISKSSGRDCFESLKHTGDRGNKDIFSWTIHLLSKHWKTFYEITQGK